MYRGLVVALLTFVASTAHAEEGVAPLEPVRHAWIADANAGLFVGNGGAWGGQFGAAGGLRLHYINFGAFLGMTLGARSMTNVGVWAGPSVPLGSWTLDLGLTFGSHGYTGVGSRSTTSITPSGTVTSGVGCSSDGADRRTGFLGGRVGISSAPKAATSVHTGVFLEYQRDLALRKVDITVNCGASSSREPVQIGGDTVLLILQLGAIGAL